MNDICIILDSSNVTVMTYDSSNATIETYGSSNVTIETYDNSIVIHNGTLNIPICNGNSIFITKNQDCIPNEHVIIQPNKKLDFFEGYGLDKTDRYVLYKRVSENFKTQENTENETVWLPGLTVTCKKWNPSISECGEGKFHAVVKPFFADRFRNVKNDRYVAILIKAEDLYKWDNPAYPYKIAFREGVVLYECDRNGNKIE